MRVVGVPDDARRLPVDPEIPDPLAHVAARAGPGLPRRIGEGVPVADPLRGRQRRVHRRQRVDQDQRRLAGTDVVGDEALLVGLQRRGQRHEQRVDVLPDRHLRADLDHVVLLAQLRDHGPLRRELVALEVGPAEQVGHRRDDADALALGPGDHADAAHELVLGRQPHVEEADHLLLGAAGERHPEEHLLHLRPRRADVADRPRLDAEGLTRLARRVREGLGVLDEHLDPRARDDVDLLEDADEVRARLHERLGHVRADERLDEDRPIRGKLVEQPPRLAAQRVQLLRRGVDADAPIGHQHACTDQGGRDGDPAHRVVQAHRIAAGAARPVPPAQNQDVQVEKEGPDRREVDDRAQADDPLREVVEVQEHPERLDRTAQSGGDGRGGRAGSHQHRAEQAGRDERDGGVAGQQRREHADRDQRRTDQPVPQVIARHQPEIGGAEIEQHPDVAERQDQRRRVDAEHGQVLAEHDLQIGAREREQQLVRSELLLLRPDPHRESRDEEEQQVGEHPVQLIEVGQVLQEEAILPERRRGAQEDEQGDEDVAAGTAEVHPQIPARECADDRRVDCASHRSPHASDELPACGSTTPVSPASAAVPCASESGPLPLSLAGGAPPPVSR